MDVITQANDDQDRHLQQDARFFAARRTMTWHHRAISPGLQMLLWSLRLYVILMLGVVLVELMRVVA
ncbi:MAG: hypothetical protein PHT60_07520 [Acidiphilium sp.]|nr:hypothetical protein [Acidiphilium sp.]MDD4935613.1 hypothetical protein [Acidiphilium sp.]